MLISHGLTPPEGWRYRQGEYWILGESFDDLVKNVKAHRESNSLVMGNVENEVELQLAHFFPKLLLKK